MQRDKLLNSFPINRRLYGRRIFLRRLKSSDAKDFFTLLDKNRNWLAPWMPEIPLDLTEEDLKSHIQWEHRKVRLGERLNLGIFLSSSSSFIGTIILHSVNWGILLSGGLGYWLDREHSGQRLMKEAASTFVSFIFEELCLHRIWAGIQLKNFRSKKLIQALGFSLEGIHKGEIFISSKWQDQYHFCLLREDYDNLADSWIEIGWLGSKPNKKVKKIFSQISSRLPKIF